MVPCSSSSLSSPAIVAVKLLCSVYVSPQSFHTRQENVTDNGKKSRVKKRRGIKQKLYGVKKGGLKKKKSPIKKKKLEQTRI